MNLLRLVVFLGFMALVGFALLNVYVFALVLGL